MVDLFVGEQERDQLGVVAAGLVAVVVVLSLAGDASYSAVAGGAVACAA